MIKSFRTLVFSAFAVLLAAEAAHASSFSFLNTRPVAINPSTPAGEESLQQILDQMFGAGAASAAAGQNAAGEWSVGVLPASLIPTLSFEYAGFASESILGLWSGTDSSALTMVDLFLGPAVGQNTTSDGFVTSASLKWNTSGTLLQIGSYDGCGLTVNCGYYSGINPFAFGFYLNVPKGDGSTVTYFTVDSLNPDGSARALAIRQGSSRDWAIAFEDGTDNDFNDAVLKVESLNPVPEPGTLVLLGTGLFGLARVARRRLPTRYHLLAKQDFPPKRGQK